MTLADKTGKVIETITTTRNHPFYVSGKGFVPAGGLAIGNAIVTRAGPDAVIVKIEWKRRAEGFVVYNFEVEDDHTYFVGSAGAWVHNPATCPPVERARFEVTSDGTAIPTSQAELEAGFPSSPTGQTAEIGTEYVNPITGVIYRIMSGNGQRSPRLITHAPAGNPLMPSGANLPGGNLGKAAIRDKTHFPLEP